MLDEDGNRSNRRCRQKDSTQVSSHPFTPTAKDCSRFQFSALSSFSSPISPSLSAKHPKKQEKQRHRQQQLLFLLQPREETIKFCLKKMFVLKLSHWLPLPPELILCITHGQLQCL
uniref:Uncharacterized protein n=1 Tax=Mesocestoides corti TaxID=53468 RepID=A0A5K3EWZ4_MESCO